MRCPKVMVAFSMDVDWAPDAILDSALQLFADKNLPVTVFATHPTKLLLNPGKNIEVGIHPNFFTSRDHAQVLDELLESYPDAKGVRSHGLFEYADLLSSYRRFGLQWDSSQLLYLCGGIRPYRHPSGLVRLPIFWEDDDYFGTHPDWCPKKLGLARAGVKCLDFHPIHLRLNSVSPAQWASARKGRLSSRAIKKAEYRSSDQGTRVFFGRLCELVADLELRTACIGEICSWV